MDRAFILAIIESLTLGMSAHAAPHGPAARESRFVAVRDDARKDGPIIRFTFQAPGPVPTPDEIAVDRMRQQFVRDVDEVEYRCYVAASDANGRRDVFDRVFQRLAAAPFGGLPPEAYKTCEGKGNVPDDAEKGPSFVARVRRGAVLVLRRVWAKFAVGELDFLVDKALQGLAGSDEPGRKTMNDTDADAAARTGLDISARIIQQYSGQAAADAFVQGNSGVKAALLANAAAAATVAREWPSPMMVWLADINRGAVSWDLKKFWQNTNPNHPDIQNWAHMSAREKGEAFKRKWAEYFRLASLAASAQITPQQYSIATGDPISKMPNPEDLVLEAFGPGMRDRYRQAKQENRPIDSAYTADELGFSAYVYLIALKMLPVISM